MEIRSKNGIDTSNYLLIIKFNSFGTTIADRFIRLDGPWVQGRCTLCNPWWEYRLSWVDIRCLDASDGRSEWSYYHWKLIISNYISTHNSISILNSFQYMVWRYVKIGLGGEKTPEKSSLFRLEETSIMVSMGNLLGHWNQTMLLAI